MLSDVRVERRVGGWVESVNGWRRERMGFSLGDTLTPSLTQNAFTILKYSDCRSSESVCFGTMDGNGGGWGG